MRYLFGATVLVALAVVTVSFVRDYLKTREDLEVRVEAYAISMATDVRWYVEVAKQTLNRVAERLDAHDESVDDVRVLSEALDDLPLGVVIVVYDANGESRAIGSHAPTPVSVSDRPYFHELREGRQWVISNLIADRLTGAKTFAIGRPLYDRGGNFNGAAVAYAPMQVFSEAWLSVGGTDSNAFIVHDEGWITARLPAIDSDVYDHRVSPDFVATFTGTPTGNYWADASPIDGIPRVVGFARVAASPLIAVIGISPSDQMMSFWKRVLMTIAVVVPIMFLLALASWRIRSLIVEQEATASSLAGSLERNENLLLEIHHRVKNNLQSTLSLLRLHVKDPAIISQIEPRIGAMVAVHEHIYRNVEFLGFPAGKYITDLAEKIIYASSDKLRLKTDIADAELPPRLAMPVGQLVNEAITNAVKYGYPDGRPGTISIRMTIDEDGIATLTIHNDGNPIPDAKGTGIGRRLMRAFAAQMGGTIDTASDEAGVTVTVVFPARDGAPSLD